jgi:hypothetical protein
MQQLYGEMLLILRRGIENGWWTVEDLNTPPPGWTYTAIPHKDPHMRVPPRPWTNPLTGEVFDQPDQGDQPYKF